jgi:hypothetical protein
MTRSGLCRIAGLTLAGFLLYGLRGDAHKPITSPYTYTDDVFPILRDRCGRCHVPGGVAPMSLMTYKDTYPWGESIRTELIAGHMPPWPVEEGQGHFKNARVLSARELNVLLTWVTGGNPLGDPDHSAARPSLVRTWPLGEPDLALSPPADYSLAADTGEDIAEFTLSPGMTGDRWVRAVDLLPGTPAVVRSATLAVRSTAAPERDRAGAAPERTLALWVPGEDPVSVDGGAAFRIPASAEIVARVHYKKTWEYERKAMTDRSTVGLYFTSSPAAEVRALTLHATDADARNGHVSFSRTLGEDLRVLALYLDPALVNAMVQLSAARPDGSRTELISLRQQPDWVRRYWFERPVTLPRGTRIDVSAVFDVPLLPPGAVPLPARPAAAGPVSVTLDVVAPPQP